MSDYKCQVNGEQKLSSFNFQNIINITLINSGKKSWPIGTRIVSDPGVITFHEMIINNPIQPNDYRHFQLICSSQEILEKNYYMISGKLIYNNDKICSFSHCFKIYNEINHQSYSYVKNSKVENPKVENSKNDNKFQLAIQNLKQEKESLLNRIQQLESEKNELQKNYEQKVQEVNNLTNYIKEKDLVSKQSEPAKNEYQGEMKGSIKISKDNNENNKTNKENKNSKNNEEDYLQMIQNQSILSEDDIYYLIDKLDKKYNVKTLFEMNEIVSAIIKGKGKMGVIEDYLFV